MKRTLISKLAGSVASVAGLLLALSASDLMAAKGPQPSICTRSCWGARSPQCTISQMSALSRGIIHHTAGSGDYYVDSLAEGKSRVRGIQNYHMSNLGWCDIAYHFICDRLGNIYEGRSGSMSSNPRGSHDSYNYNSFGFNILGYFHPPYNQQPTSAGLNALWSVIAWRMPSTWSPYGSGTYNGRTVSYLDDHRSVNGSACPGDIMIAKIPAGRDTVWSKKSGGSVPKAPSGLVATTYSSTRIDLKWVDNSSNESGFRVFRRRSDIPDYTQIATVGANVKAYSSTGLAAGTTYYFRIKSYNSIGESAYSNYDGATTKDTIPAGPSGLTATAVSNDQINLAWTCSAGNEDGFRVYRSTDGTNFTQIATPGINATSYNNTGLTGNRKYWYKVYSYNTAGNSAASNIASDTTAPQAPSALTAASAGATQINLTWTDNASAEVGFKIERATAAAGPFTQIATNAASDATYSNTGLAATTTYWYRVRTYNANGNSDYSNTASATTGNAPPVLGAIGDKTVASGANLSFTATATDPNASNTTTTWQTFTSFPHNTPNETVLFKKPANSLTTSAFIDTAVTNYTRVVSNGPSAWGTGNKSMIASWSFKTGTANYWVRLNTSNTATNGNPIIALDQKLQFKFQANHTVQLGLGIRETGSTGAYGANGGITGVIEWVGVTNVVSGHPVPNKQIALNTSTTAAWDLPFETTAAFTGDGIVPQNNVKGVLEHVIVKGLTTGVHNMWFDDFAVIQKNNNAFVLDAGAPAGAAIGYRTGKFSWTPTTAQVGLHTITVRVTDRLGAVDFETIKVTVTGSGNTPPSLAAIGAKTVKELNSLTFTATATDANAGQTLTFSLDAGAPAGASISTAGAFAWTPTEAQGAGNYPITVRVTDNGSPTSNDFETVTVTVQEVNAAPSLAAIADQTVNEAITLNLTASGSDSDVPANALTYSLVNGPPAMTVHATTGAISWTPTEADGSDIHQVTVKVADNGAPSLYSTRTFNVTVNEANTAPVVTLGTTSTKVNTFAHFDDTDDDWGNGVVMFRHPLYSSTSSAFLDASPNSSDVETSPTFPLPDDNTSLKVLKTTFSFKTGTVNPWLRLTTYTMQTNHAFVPNPTINLNSTLRFKVYTDKAIKLGIGVRETSFNAPIGFNGGVSGTIEYVGVSGKQANGCPIPTRTIAAGAWTTVTFTLPTEAITAFSGNGALATGKGTLEQIAIVPDAGMGAYNVYFDDLEVVTTDSSLVVDTLATISFSNSATDSDTLEGGATQTLEFSLAAGAPTNAEIDIITGTFTWTPTPEQSPSTNVIGITVTDDGSPALSDTKNVTIIVNKVNTVPKLGNIPEDEVEASNGQALTFDVEADDDDLPADTLTFSLQAAPTGATINSSSGVINWTTPSSGTITETFTVRITDNGSPVLFADDSFKVVVKPGNVAPVLTLGGAVVTEPVVTYESFTNGTPNEQVMFKKPSNSTTTSAFIDTVAANATTITTSYPAGNPNAASTKALKADWTFKTGLTDYWVRLTTFNAALLANPTFNVSARLKVDVYCNQSIQVAIGIRETGTTAENGANGGTTGTIEFVGAGTKQGNGRPNPTRTVPANTWTTLEFDMPNEAKIGFTGDGILNGGQQVLEHLAIVGTSTGAHTMYLDNFQVVETVSALDSSDTGAVKVNMKSGSTLTFDASATDTDPLTFSLEASSPAASTINSSSGVFSWTPSAADAGTTNSVGVIVQDSPSNGGTPKLDSDEFIVNVNADTLGAQSSDDGSFIAGGDTVTLTWDAADGASYELQAKATGASDWNSQGSVKGGSVTVTNDGSDAYFRVIEVSGAGE